MSDACFSTIRFLGCANHDQCPECSLGDVVVIVVVEIEVVVIEVAVIDVVVCVVSVLLVDVDVALG